MTDQQSSDNHMQDRINGLFSGQNIPSYASIAETESMQARIRELEEELVQMQAGERSSSSRRTTATNPSITQPAVRKETPTEQPKQVPEYLFRAALFMVGAALFSLPLYAYLAARMHLWQLNALIGISLVFAAACALSAWLVRRGRVALGGNLLLGGLSLIVLAVPMLIAGLQLILGLAFPLAILIAVSPTLSRRVAIRTTIASALVGVTTIVLSSFWQSNQITIPELQVAIPGIAVINAILIGLMVIRQFPSYPLRIKLVVVLVGVALFSIGAVAFALNSIMSGLIREDVGDDLSVLAQNKALEIGTTVTHEKNTLETLTLNQFLRWEADVINGSHTAKDLDRLDQQWREGADDDPLIAQVLNNAMAVELHHFQARFPQFVEIFLTDSYGANIASTNRTSDYYQADEEWWRAAWNDEKGNTYVSQATFDESAGIYAIDIALPFYNDHSRLIGILRATVDVTPFKEALRAGNFAQTGKIELVFPDRQVLTSDVDTSLFQLDPDSAAGLDSLQTSFDQFNYEGSPSVVSKKLVSTGEVKDKQTIEQLGWYVVVHQDESEALLPVRISTRTALILTLLMLLFTSALAVYVGRLLTTPLAQLTSVVAQVSQGNLTAQANIHSRDEIGTLASTFNSMTTQLHGLITSMEQRVEERTHDLKLAAEVGRAVSEKVGDLNVLLTEAAETIRSNFDLYYTQVYLVDPSGHSLVLRAGTGEVGMQLLQRGHRLTVASTSLNGRAALERLPVYIGDTQSSSNFLPNPLLPLTRSELAVPLIANDKVVGVLDMQSQRPETFSEASLPAFQVLAGQLAIAIQNAALFAKVEMSRLEVEEQAHHLTASGWQDFLNAIDRSEKIGFSFHENEMLSTTEIQSTPFENVLEIPVEIMGAKVGEIRLAGESSRAWTSAEKEVVASTASRVGQHIENLRLLAQADRYRAQAEQAVRRLTREGWDNYTQLRAHETLGYVYDLTEVQPLSTTSNGHSPATFTQPLLVRGETIGELSVNGIEDQAQLTEIITAVADQLSKHIENLRLTEETERRSSELATVAGQLSEALEIARLANWEYDLEKDIFTFNDQFYSIFHTTVEQVGGYELSSARYAQLFVHPDDAALVGEEIGKAIASTDRHYTKQLEHRILFADGGVGYISVDVNIERDENGKITRWYGANQDITERKKSEEELLKVRLGMDRANDAVFITDTNGSIVYTNPAFERIYGWTKEEAIGQTPRLIKSGLVPLQQYQEFWNRLLKNETVAGELTNKTKDGRLIPIEASNNAIVDGKGKIIGFLGLHRDITDRKLAEEAIRKEQKRTQAILESVTVPMVITRLSDNHLTFVNSPALEVTQFKYEDVINQPAPDFYYNPDDRKKFITDLRAKGEVSDMVVQLRRGNGEVFWALLSARIFDYQSEASILTTFMDISERIRAEEAIAKRATELAAVANVSTTASTLLNPDQLLQSVVDLTKDYFALYHAHIYLADESWQTLLLAAGAGEVGRKMVAEGWNIPLDHQNSIVADTARSRKSVIANDVYHDKDSSFLSNRLLPETRSEMAVPIIVGEKLLGVFDVQSTETGRFTEEDANIYITLASQIGVALQNARLYMEQAATLTQLRELDKLKSSFLANMSHELRTPLNSILGFTDVMLEGLDGSLTEYMDNDLRLIQKNGQHLLHLINDVLDMAKIEAGRMNLNPETFKVHEVLQEVTSITSTLANEKNLPLVIEECSDQNIEIYADRTRFRQVLINLVNNAIKFTDKGQVVLNVSPMDGARVSITVKDTGIGIPSDNLETIFQEFTQVDSSTTRKTGGTGLGLPISRRLVEMHGGRVWAESVGIPGEGSTLFVELPVEARITDIIEKQAK